MIAPAALAATLLLALDGLEQRLEVALSEALGSLALNDLDEERGAILQRFGEELQQITLIVTVHQDAQFGQRCKILFDRTNAFQ